ncbi:MAG: aldo/keto reductase [Thermoproteota archaeon]
MQYRKFGKKIDWAPSALGFGMMRLPTIDGTQDSAAIQYSKAKRMVRYAIHHGLNYIDTAWPYHGGQSERFLGRILREGCGEKVRIATKMPSWEIKEPADLDEFFNKQLARLQTNHIDFYLLHCLNEERWKNYRTLGVSEWIEKVKDEGKIDHIGFSFHDDLDTFKEIVDSYSWDFCQIQYNYIDQDFQAGRAGLQYASKRGLGVVIMEPLRGGQLATELPEKVLKVLEDTGIKRNPVEWALLWLWDQPEVSVVLSGMSTLNQVKENLKIAHNSGIGQLTQEEKETLERAREVYEGMLPVKCTGCNYCVTQGFSSCPQGIRIPYLLDLYNKAHLYKDYEERKAKYYDLEKESRASACINCGHCEERCPQKLPITDLMEEIKEYFEDEQI